MYSDFVSFRQHFVMTGETYFEMLLEKAVLYGTLFTDKRLESLSINSVLLETPAQPRQLLSYCVGIGK